MRTEASNNRNENDPVEHLIEGPSVSDRVVGSTRTMSHREGAASLPDDADAVLLRMRTSTPKTSSDNHDGTVSTAAAHQVQTRTSRTSSNSNKRGRTFSHSAATTGTAAQHYQVRIGPVLIVSIWLGSFALPHLAGRWIWQHRPEWADAIRETVSIMMAIGTLVRQEQTTPQQVQEAGKRTGNSCAPDAIDEEESSVVHHWYYDSSATTTSCSHNYDGHQRAIPEGGEHHTCSNNNVSDDTLILRNDNAQRDHATATIPTASSSSDHQHDDKPALGQHLLVDLDHVDGAFLASEERLTQALVQLAADSGLTMLSYHCHNSSSSSAKTNEGRSIVREDAVRFVSCVGVLLESHVALYSFPALGKLALDLFTCGGRDNSPLLALLPHIETMFGLSSSEEENDDDDANAGLTPRMRPHMVWSHKRRGFIGDDNINHNDDGVGRHRRRDADYQHVLANKDNEKIQIVHEKTVQHDVHIVDVDDRTSRDRSLYIDGHLQGRRHGEGAYHEALVHAGMFVHRDPKRVAILGGGEGAIVREVLKHDTVEQVVMMESDERLVGLAREYLPEWSDCGNLIGSTTASCFDDPRVAVMVTNGLDWFVDQFGNETSSTSRGIAPFDVIIIDALDPESILEYSDLFYGDADLIIEAFSRALGDHGVLVTQAGEAPGLNDAALPLQLKRDDGRSHHSFIESLADADFQSIFEYDESHGRVLTPWRFVVAVKDAATRARWFRSEAELQLDVVKRCRSLKDTNELPLRFFDGATFMTYQFPNRIVEEIWCRNNQNQCPDGHGFDPSLPDRTGSWYTVGPSSVANGGRGVFATENIPKGSYLGNEECVSGIFVPPSTSEILESFTLNEVSDGTRYWTTVYKGYVEGYGWEMEYYGNHASGIETSPLTFVNHGCNKTYSIGDPTDVSELTVDLETLDQQTFFDDKNEPYNPYNERDYPAWQCPRSKSLRDIAAGEELLDNYIVMGGSGSDVYDFVAELKSMCSGGIGSVTQYERQHDEGNVKGGHQR